MESYDRQVYLTKVDYQQKMNDTKKAFIEGKYDGVSQQEFNSQVDSIWTIDHSYMERQIQEQTDKVRMADHVAMLEQQNLPNRYELNDVSDFTKIETNYGNYIKRAYGSSNENDVDYLTKRILAFEKLERTIAYYRNGKVYSMHTPAEYLSMLFNVNMRMASWNQTIKDSQLLGNDLVILESHPNACEDCLIHMGKIYSVSGKDKRYPSIEQAYKEGVGHPNCKCNFSIFWYEEQLRNQGTDIEQYTQVQQGRALQRDIDRYSLDYDLFRYIGNEEEADKTITKIGKLQSLLNELLILYDISSYIF